MFYLLPNWAEKLGTLIHTCHTKDKTMQKPSRTLASSSYHLITIRLVYEILLIDSLRSFQNIVLSVHRVGCVCVYITHGVTVRAPGCVCVLCQKPFALRTLFNTNANARERACI